MPFSAIEEAVRRGDVYRMSPSELMALLSHVPGALDCPVGEEWHINEGGDGSESTNTINRIASSSTLADEDGNPRPPVKRNQSVRSNFFLTHSGDSSPHLLRAAEDEEDSDSSGNDSGSDCGLEIHGHAIRRSGGGGGGGRRVGVGGVVGRGSVDAGSVEEASRRPSDGRPIAAVAVAMRSLLDSVWSEHLAALAGDLRETAEQACSVADLGHNEEARRILQSCARAAILIAEAPAISSPRSLASVVPAHVDSAAGTGDPISRGPSGPIPPCSPNDAPGSGRQLSTATATGASTMSPVVARDHASVPSSGSSASASLSSSSHNSVGQSTVPHTSRDTTVADAVASAVASYEAILDGLVVAPGFDAVMENSDDEADTDSESGDGNGVDVVRKGGAGGGGMRSQLHVPQQQQQRMSKGSDAGSSGGGRAAEREKKVQRSSALGLVDLASMSASVSKSSTSLGEERRRIVQLSIEEEGEEEADPLKSHAAGTGVGGGPAQQQEPPRKVGARVNPLRKVGRTSSAPDGLLPDGSPANATNATNSNTVASLPGFAGSSCGGGNNNGSPPASPTLRRMAAASTVERNRSLRDLLAKNLSSSSLVSLGVPKADLVAGGHGTGTRGPGSTGAISPSLGSHHGGGSQLGSPMAHSIHASGGMPSSPSDTRPRLQSVAADGPLSTFGGGVGGGGSSRASSRVFSFALGDLQPLDSMYHSLGENGIPRHSVSSASSSQGENRRADALRDAAQWTVKSNLESPMAAIHRGFVSTGVARRLRAVQMGFGPSSGMGMWSSTSSLHSSSRASTDATDDTTPQLPSEANAPASGITLLHRGMVCKPVRLEKSAAARLGLGSGGGSGSKDVCVGVLSGAVLLFRFDPKSLQVVSCEVLDTCAGPFTAIYDPTLPHLFLPITTAAATLHVGALVAPPGNSVASGPWESLCPWSVGHAYRSASLYADALTAAAARVVPANVTGSLHLVVTVPPEPKRPKISHFGPSPSQSLFLGEMGSGGGGIGSSVGSSSSGVGSSFGGPQSPPVRRRRSFSMLRLSSDAARGGSGGLDSVREDPGESSSSLSAAAGAPVPLSVLDPAVGRRRSSSMMKLEATRSLDSVSEEPDNSQESSTEES